MTNHVVATIDEIISLLEAEIPGNQNSPGNQKLKVRLERDLAKYFRALENAFPYGKLASIYNRNVKESLGSDTGDILNPLLANFDADLTASVNGHLASTYVSGQAEMITWGKTKGGVPITYEGPPIRQAVDWAEKRSATSVTQMGEETKRRLAHTISRGIEGKRGIPGLAKDIRDTFADMTKHRSELIAKTETADALSAASLNTMEDMGIDGKEWVTVGDARVDEVDCRPNGAQGVIPVGQAFQSGHMAPTAHPGCRCALAPARLRGR